MVFNMNFNMIFDMVFSIMLEVGSNFSNVPSLFEDSRFFGFPAPREFFECPVFL